jgi:hypothetical protein
MPSLVDWEEDWKESPQFSEKQKLLPVDFQLPFAVVARIN